MMNEKIDACMTRPVAPTDAEIDRMYADWLLEHGDEADGDEPEQY